ncbi:MAG: FecR family protein [Cytophagales bacterium]|nr:FecR family protein [Cytophagales bacterium]
MKNSLIYRFFSRQLSREELHDLYDEVNHREADILDSIERDWERFQLKDEVIWPAGHWNKLQAKINSASGENVPGKGLRMHWFARIAASLLVILSIWLGFDLNKSKEDATGSDPALITKVNDSDKPSIVVLSDGTKVTLTAHSSLSFYENFNHRYRVVHLDGEAYFETDGKNKRPFVVISENITSICRGEEFSISAFKESDEINVTLASGQIEISRNDKLNSENNKIAVRSCQRYSFSKTTNEYLIGQISDCEYAEKARSMKESASGSIVML